MNESAKIVIFDRGTCSERHPVMVHGTSIESTIKLLSKGKLPSSFEVNQSSHPADNGHLFFVPRKKSFVITLGTKW